MNNELEQIADDLTFLTSQNWSHKPFLCTGSRQSIDLSLILDWLVSQDAITGYKTLGLSVNGRRTLSKYKPGSSVTIQGENAEKIKALAEYAKTRIELLEKVSHLLGLMMNTTFCFDPIEVVMGNEGIDLYSFSPQDIQTLKELETKGFIELRGDEDDPRIVPIDAEGLIQYLEPRLTEQKARYERNKKAIELLGLATEGRPWFEAHHITQHAPYIQSGSLKKTDGAYRVLWGLRDAGAIWFDYPDDARLNGFCVPIRVKDLNLLEKFTRETQEHLAELHKVRDALKKITGYKFHVWGDLHTTYEYGDPTGIFLLRNLEELRSRRLIDFEKRGGSPGKDDDGDTRVAITKYNLGRLKQLAIELAIGSQELSERPAFPSL